MISIGPCQMPRETQRFRMQEALSDSAQSPCSFPNLQLCTTPGAGTAQGPSQRPHRETALAYSIPELIPNHSSMSQAGGV